MLELDDSLLEIINKQNEYRIFCCAYLVPLLPYHIYPLFSSLFVLLERENCGRWRFSSMDISQDFSFSSRSNYSDSHQIVSHFQLIYAWNAVIKQGHLYSTSPQHSWSQPFFKIVVLNRKPTSGILLHYKNKKTLPIPKASYWIVCWRLRHANVLSKPAQCLNCGLSAVTWRLP